MLTARARSRARGRHGAKIANLLRRQLRCVPSWRRRFSARAPWTRARSPSLWRRSSRTRSSQQGAASCAACRPGVGSDSAHGTVDPIAIRSEPPAAGRDCWAARQRCRLHRPRQGSRRAALSRRRAAGGDARRQQQPPHHRVLTRGWGLTPPMPPLGRTEWSSLPVEPFGVLAYGRTRPPPSPLSSWDSPPLLRPMVTTRLNTLGAAIISSRRIPAAFAVTICTFGRASRVYLRFVRGRRPAVEEEAGEARRGSRRRRARGCIPFDRAQTSVFKG